MRFQRQRITIMSTRRPPLDNVNQKLQWLGSSLGLFNLRDKDRSCFRIFIEIVKYGKNQQGLSSDEIAYRLHLTRGTVIHHINKLIESGVVIPDGKRYVMRVQNLHELVDEIEKDLIRTCDDLKKIANEIDQWIGH